MAKTKKLIEIVAEGEYRLPFKPNRKIKRHAAPTHKKFGAIYAIDWAMPIGTPILAAREGKIVERESRYNHYGGEECTNMANYVVIEHENGESSMYAHFKWRGVKVKKGQMVKARQVIGYSGRTGFATYPHLHFAVYKIVNEKEINAKVKFSNQEK